MPENLVCARKPINLNKHLFEVKLVSKHVTKYRGCMYKCEYAVCMFVYIFNPVSIRGN